MPYTTNTIIRNYQQQDLMNELRVFIGGATRNVKCNPLELARTALSLLKTLPAARDAILEYFCDVFDTAVKNYIEQIETEIATGQMPQVPNHEEATISEIHTVLCNFVNANAEAWAPIISAWSLELLGELSSKYAGRAHIPPGLNETLQLWMNCRATRTLIDITTQCLSCLIHADTEACINALLDTSIKHSPNFDWVVAHVGSCFPNTVITRVLSCGLKDFSQHKSIEQGKDASKLISVVGILGHLAGSHFCDIRMALLDLFKWSLEPLNVRDNETKLMRNATVPFLLQLASMSATLLKAITIDVKTTIPLSIIVQLSEMSGDWCKYFGSAQLLLDLLVHLIIGCERGAAQIILLLLDCIFSEEEVLSSNPEVRKAICENSRELLEYVLQEMDLLTRAQTQNNLMPIKIIESLTSELPELYPILLSPEKLKYETVARIIIYIGSMHHSVLIKSLSYLLQRAKSDEHLAVLFRILSDEFITKTGADTLQTNGGGGNLSEVLETTLKNPISDFDEDVSFQQMWLNLLTLLRWEKSKQSLLFNSLMISRALCSNLINITNVFNDSDVEFEVLHTIIEIVYTLDVPSNGNSLYVPPLQLVLNLTNCAVNYFFICCEQKDMRVRIQGQKHICGIIRRLCWHSKVAKALALKEILEQSIFTKRNVLFGAHVNSQLNNSQDHLLLQQIKTMNKTVAMTRHSSVYNGGIVGHGKQKLATNNHLSQQEIGENVKQLIQLLKSCCMMPPNQVENDSERTTSMSLESLTNMSLLLVQFVSPDVMYNGLPWPEEEFSKVTIERDLYIRRLFNSTPALWEMLRLVALHRPALCYCSVLLRALTATLLHQWNSMGDQSKTAESTSYKLLMEITIKVLDVMTLGQLLPPPLSSIRDVVPYLQCVEIVSILRDCVWNYMRDHIPSPALFGCDSSGLHWRDPIIARPPSQYTDTLRIIMQKNIKTVGHLFSQMFINIPHSEE